MEAVLAILLRAGAIGQKVPVHRASRESLAVLAAPGDALAHKLVPGVLKLYVSTENAGHRPVRTDIDGRDRRARRAPGRHVGCGSLSNRVGAEVGRGYAEGRKLFASSWCERWWLVVVEIYRSAV